MPASRVGSACTRRYRRSRCPAVHLSLRIHRASGLDLARLVAAGSLHPAFDEVLEALIAARLAFVITGGAGTGKTTLLGALLARSDPGERILVVEDTAELTIDHPHVVRLQARPPNVEGAGEITLRELVRQALRMRPDRVIVGEVRGAELLDMLVAGNTGHDGGLTTLHANGVADVPARVEALAMLAGLPRAAAHSLLASALRVAVHLERGRDGFRRVAEIAVLERGEGDLVRAVTALRWAGGHAQVVGGRRIPLAASPAGKHRPDPRRAGGVVIIELRLGAAAALAGCTAWLLTGSRSPGGGWRRAVSARRRPWFRALTSTRSRWAAGAVGAGGARRPHRTGARHRRRPDRLRARPPRPGSTTPAGGARPPGAKIWPRFGRSLLSCSAASRRQPPCAWPPGPRGRPAACAAGCSTQPPAMRSEPIPLRCCAPTPPRGPRRAALAAAWSVCQRSGSSLAAPVGRLAEGAAAELRVEREADAALASARSSARLLAVLPLAGAVLGQLSGSGSLRVLLTTGVGQACLVVGVALDLAGLAWLERLADAAGA